MKRRYVSRDQQPSASHNRLQLVRTHLGLTQQDIANLLLVSRSAVALYERGDRMLPWRTDALLDALYTVLPPPVGTAPALPVPAPVLSDAGRDELRLRRMGLAVQLYPLGQQLARCQLRLSQAQRWQQALPALRAALPTDRELVPMWLDYFGTGAEETLREESSALLVLQLRSDALAFEIGGIDRLLGEEQVVGES